MDPKDVAKNSEAIDLARKAGPSLPAVSYRATVLGLLTLTPQAPLEPWTKDDGQLDDAVFWAAACIAMEWMPVGLSENFPFDVEELVRRVRDHKRGPVQ